MKKIVEVKNLTRKFGKFTAVDNISFDVEAGTMFGFLGPNGAGKSTTINILSTTDEKTSGQVTINGYDLAKDPKKIRKEIGIVFQQHTIDEKLTAYENLNLHCAFYDVPKNERKAKIEEVLSLVELSKEKNDIVGGFSGGMKRRLEIARALVHTPKVLFLDEPTTGLDPHTRQKIWEYILDIQKKSKMTIFLTTHYLEEAEVCEKIAIIDHGKIVEFDTPNNLKNNFGHDEALLYADDLDKLLKNVQKVFKEYKDLEIILKKDHILIKGNKIGLTISSNVDKLALNDIEIKKANLDNVFINITGREIRN